MAEQSEPEYQLTYFDFAGIAEPIRFIFNYAQVPFADERLEWDQKWTDELKQKFPWGMLPVLKSGDLELSQSVAICRFLGKKFGLCGRDDFESAKCDELVDTIGDLRAEWVRVFIEQDGDRKIELKTNFSTKLSTYYAKLGNILDKNGGSYFVGSGLTWTDLYIAYFLDFFDFDHKDVLSSFPNLEKFKAEIYELPAIKAWINSRPKDFDGSSLNLKE